MNKRKSLLLIIAAVIVLSLVAGCDSEEEDSYDLAVRWNISGFNTCQTFLPADQYVQPEITFSQVQITVYEDETTMIPVKKPPAVNCLAGEQIVTELHRDSYFITVDAIGNYDGADLAFFHGEATVAVPDKETIDIPLTVAKGKIVVNWQFTNGLICGIAQAGEVTDVAVAINGQEFEAPCGEGHIVLDKIVPGGANTITARALNESGNVLYQTTYSGNPFQVLPGQVFAANVIF